MANNINNKYLVIGLGLVAVYYMRKYIATKNYSRGYANGYDRAITFIFDADDNEKMVYKKYGSFVVSDIRRNGEPKPEDSETEQE